MTTSKRIQRALPALLIAAASAALPAQAAECRSEAAAKVGSRQGYERDKAAAIETEKREGASSDLISRCLGGITSVPVVPTFPSLQQVFTQVAQKMCHVARDKIRDAMPTSTGLPAVPTASLPAPAATAPREDNETAAKEDYWSRIWR